MTRTVELRVAEAILSAPGWARVGITAPAPYLREDAAHELARAILASLDSGSDLSAPESPGLAL